VCYRCDKSDHFIAKCTYSNESDRDEDKKGKKKMEKKKYYKKKGGEAHMGREWDSDESSTDSSSDEDAANIAVNKGLLFPNVDLLKRFGMKDAKPAKTLMETDGHVDLNKGGKSIDQKAYRSMIGSLLYLCASRPDIMLSVCMCARYQSDPKEYHLVVVKRILRYLVAMSCFGI
jgi:hypothetical protein